MHDQMETNYANEKNDKLDELNKKVRQILGYASCPYLIILDLSAQIAKAFQAFKVEDD